MSRTASPAPRAPQVGARGALSPVGSGVLEPRPGVDFSRLLAGEENPPVKATIGALLALTGYALLVPVVAQLLAGLDWIIQGRPGAFATYLKEDLAFLHPGGLVAANLALATLTPVALVLVRFWNRRRPAWAASVAPGLRWRYLGLCLVVAAVVLNAVLWLGRARGGVTWDPQHNLAVWLVLVLLTSPLQAAAEEFFFRGYLLQSLGSVVRDEQTSRRLAVVGSAFVFALFHGMQNPALFVDRFGFGLLAGALVLLTGGLEAGIACHVANNLFAFLWAALAGGIAQARALQSITWATAASDLLGFALFGLVAWWLSRRMGLATRSAAV